MMPAAPPGFSVLAIDPGATGALALLRLPLGVNPAGVVPELLALAGMPTERIYLKSRTLRRVSAPDLALTLKSMLYDAPRVAHVGMEKVHSFPTDGPQAAYSFGHAAGTGGAVAQLITGRRVIEISPQEWRRAVGLRTSAGEGKAPSIARACEIWPAFAPDFSAHRDGGRAEAALIGLGLIGLIINRQKEAPAHATD